MKRAPITDAQRQTIIDLLPVATSLRQIAEAIDLDRSTVQAAAAPFLMIMRAAGTLGRCPCGKERYHPRICAGNHKRLGGQRAIDEGRRSAIIAAILTGALYKDIGSAFGVDRASIRKYLRFLTPAQLERRKALERARFNERNLALVARPNRDALYRRIAAMVPRWLDNHLQDDVISETYLAVLEGALSTSDLRPAVERFAKVARDTFASKWGARSIDAPISPGTDLRLADCIADPSALAAFDHIFEEAL